MATGERVAPFLNSVPVDLDRVYRTFNISVAKLHLFHEEINDRN